MIEIYKDIIIDDISFPYQVSNFGNIRSLDRIVNYSDGRKRLFKGISIKCTCDSKGYPRVVLHNDIIKGRQFMIHRLVAFHFIENPDNKPCVNHKDGIRVNFHCSNLEWCTHSENTLDGIKRGTINNPGKKLMLEEVLKIRDLYKFGIYNQYKLAKIFSVGQVQISRIVNNINWKL